MSDMIRKKLRYYSLIYEMTDSKCCKCDCYAEMNKKQTDTEVHIQNKKTHILNTKVKQTL